MGRFIFVKDPVSGKMMFVDTGDKSSVKLLAKNGNSFIIGGPSSMYKTSFNPAQSLHAIKAAEEKKRLKEIEEKDKRNKALNEEKKERREKSRAAKIKSAQEQTGLKGIAEFGEGMPESIRKHLLTGTEQINKYISAKTRSMKELSATELAKPEYKNLRRLARFLRISSRSSTPLTD